MKIIAPVLLGLCMLLAARAQDTAPPPSAPDASANAATRRSPETLDTLLGPIALYPDPLVALILPASTTPSDVVLAARYLDAGNDPAAVDNQSWSESVKALVHYPDVVKWMNTNLEWTQALGQAFLDQPADVMNSVQRLRARAKASGALVDTPQQHVLSENGQILIVPAQPDIVYVPLYDPAVVYIERTGWNDGPFLTFGFGYPIGPWFIYDCDWGRHTVWVTSRPANWRNNPQYWRYAGPRPAKLPGRPWHPPVNHHPRPVSPVYAHPPTPRPIVRPDENHSPHRPPSRPPATTTAPSHAMHPATLPAAPAPVSVAPAPSAPLTRKPTTTPPPSAFPHPAKPRDAAPVDRSHHPRLNPPPIVRPAPAPSPTAPQPPVPAETDPRKNKQGP